MVFQRSCSVSLRPPRPSLVIIVILKTPLEYFRGLIKNVNEREDEYETQTRKLGTVLVKVYILRKKCDIQSDPRLA